MKIEKLEMSQSKFDINAKFYFFLKYSVKSKLTNNQSTEILEIYSLNSKLFYEKQLLKITEYIKGKIKSSDKKYFMSKIIEEIHKKEDLELFIFSLKLYIIKDLLLEEAKLKKILDITKLQNLHLLSLEYDNILTYNAYSTRINGALLSLMFFDKLDNKETNFISKDADDFIKNLSKTAIKLKDKGIEPNQIFMLIFSESISQSDKSNSGSNYEERILSVLTSIGVDEQKIEKTHDKDDSSTEFDFFFELKDKTYGIGAKRTLRERYKQFIKTAQMSEIDVMIEITLGIDLTEEKVKAIRNHNVFLFVADEVYSSNRYLQNIAGVYSSKDLTIEVLESL